MLKDKVELHSKGKDHAVVVRTIFLENGKMAHDFYLFTGTEGSTAFDDIHYTTEGHLNIELKDGVTGIVVGHYFYPNSMIADRYNLDSEEWDDAYEDRMKQTRGT